MKEITSEVLTCFEDEIPLILKNGASFRQHQVQMALDVADTQKTDSECLNALLSFSKLITKIVCSTQPQALNLSRHY